MEIQLTLKPYIILATILIHTFVASAQSYNNIEFIENKGQWDDRVKYKGEVSAGAFFIRSGGFTVLQHNREDYDRVQSMLHGHKDKSGDLLSRDEKIVIRSHAYNVDFIGASKDLQVVPDKILPGYNNYFIGDDPSKWAGECRVYQAISFKNVYPGVDVRYYTDNNTLKYDIIARPGADISKIALRYEGAEKLQVKNKELIVSTSVGELKEAYPYTYQANGKERKEVNCRYIVKDNIVRFDVKGYDPSATLVIDPFLIFCSFSGSSANNWGFTATYGPDSSFYGGGIVFANGFPVLPGAFQTTYAGGVTEHPGPVDIGIIKLTPNGSNRVYATYIGGSGNDQPHSLVVDQQGNLVLAGRTSSPLSGNGSYPVTGGAAGLIGPCGGHDIVVTKLNGNGSALIGSKRVGGTGNDGVNITTASNNSTSLHHNYGDGSRSEVILDGAANIYVASCTQSNNFPATPSAFQTGFGGGLQDAVVLKFASNVSSMTFASYLGGSASDAAYVLSLAPTGDIYVAGGTESTNFFGSQAGTVGTANHGGIDGFVAQISNNGTNIIRSTYIGTSGYDQVYGIQFDRNGFPYIMGQTTGAWPAINAVYVDANAKQFIGKLQPDLSAYIYTTTFGTSSAIPNISPIAFLVDRCENVYVSGWGGDIVGNNAFPNAGTTGMRVTPDAYKPTTDGKDFYFFVLARNASSPNPLYASFFGQDGGLTDHVDGGTSRFDANGIIYQGVCANCAGGAVFPTTLGAWSTTKPASAFCNLGMVKMAFNLAGVRSNVQSAIGGVPLDTAGCVPLTVVFTDQIRTATEYIWNFGDGTPDVGPLPAATGYTQSHVYNATGTFRVMLVAIDPNSCNVRDTSYVNIRVGDLIANLAATAVKITPPCDANRFQFNNLSTTNPIRPFTNTSFVWKFGDGSAPVVAGLTSVTHDYPAPGSYIAWLILTDTAYCNYPDSISIPVDVAANVDASFTTPPVGCAPYTAEFDNTTIGGQTYQWDFGDPASGASNTSTAFEPTHLYNTPGTYIITMVATNPNTCNITDTARFTIVVYSQPLSDFTYTPVTPVENTPNTFINQSSPDAVSFKWVFGDGDSLLTTSRAPFDHQYNSTGTFNACLYAYNNVGCFAVRCRPVSTIIVPALDVPNAFTPNTGDGNSVIYVRGFGIAKMRFIIWNRWGQKVFETNDWHQGWNGRVKGVVQPMDVYAYTLDVEFFDGTKATKKGDITLIR
ncbi:MAG TPA: PKD domain-containing protein [Chitinophagaceae bacterium]